MAGKIKWKMKAEYLQGCNCDWGCPCNFNAPPKDGRCEGGSAYRIVEGNYGEVKLDGIRFGRFAAWPSPIHLGRGVGALYIDERADQKQREALIKITTGEAGGGPFPILASTLSKVIGPRYVPFQFKYAGKKSSVRIGNHVDLQLEPMKNPTPSLSS